MLEIFNASGNPFNSLVQDLENPDESEVISIGEGKSILRLGRDDDGTMYSFDVYFIKNDFGEWKIEKF